MKFVTKKRVIWLIVLAVLGGGGFAWYRLRGGRSQDPVKFETATADRGRIVGKVTATGTVSALVTVQVGSQVSGRIAQLFADFNSPVKKGQLVAKVDAQIFEAALEQTRANHLAARANLERSKVQAADARRQYDRAKALAAQKLIAQADLDTAQANADAAKASVDAAAGAVAQAQASLHQAQVNLAYTDIVAPTDGVVVSRNVDVGQTVAAAFQAPVLFTIAEDLRKMQVDTNVAEADIGKLKPGMPASFVVDAYPGERFQGSVRMVRKAPQTLQNIVTYDAVIDVANPDQKLMPGMTANVTFVFAERNDVIRVPNAAMRFQMAPDVLARARGEEQPRTGGARAATATGGGSADAPASSDARDVPNRRSVWVMREGVPVQVFLTTGASDGSMPEVVDGDVKAGDVLVTDAPASSGPPRGGGIRFP